VDDIREGFGEVLEEGLWNMHRKKKGGVTRNQ